MYGYRKTFEAKSDFCAGILILLSIYPEPIRMLKGLDLSSLTFVRVSRQNIFITFLSLTIMNKILSIASIIAAWGFTLMPLSVYALSVEQYCSPKDSAPKAIKRIKPMADGASYAAISDDGRSIETYSYKTGQRLNVIFSIDRVKGDVKIDEFDGYEICSNGKKILLWNDVQRIYRHSFTAEYYVYDIMRGTLSRVSSQGCQRGAVISHDGRMVAYVRDNDIYISNLDYGTDTRITNDGAKNRVINGVSDWSYEEEFSLDNTMRWSADDNILAFMRFDESEVPVYSFDDYKSYCSKDPLGDLYPEAYSYKYPLAGYPNSIVTVKSYNLDTRVTKTMDLNIGKNYVPSIEFDGQGKDLMVMVVNRDQNDLKLYKVNPGSTVAHQIYSDRSSAWLSPSAYQMVKYGESSFIIGSERSGYCHLYEYDYSGNLKKTLTSGEWNVTDYYGIDPKSGYHYFQSTILGAVNRNICSVSRSGKIEILNNKEGFEIGSFSRDMQYYVRNYSNITTPNQYTICDQRGKAIHQLEMNEAYASLYASAPKKELRVVKNAQGEEMAAYVIYPQNFDASKTYPLLMYQYNGPDSQEVVNRWKMDGTFYLASKGYVVGAVDGRGTGYRSREWAQCVYRQLGKCETEDQIAGAKQLATLPGIDSNRIACFGWSYGGYMTLMELTAENSPFIAGVSMAPVTDWRFYDSIYTERYMSTPQQNPEGYEQASTLPRTGKLKARLLIMSGTSDDNVHYYNTLKYTSKINSEGKIFDMMSFTGFEHSLPMCNARVQLYRKVEDFLNSHLK